MLLILADTVEILDHPVGVSSGVSDLHAGVFSETTQLLDEVLATLEVPAGELAVLLLHDTNGNLEMDYTWYGYPEEGAAATNGAVGGLLGPAPWSEAVVSVLEPTTLTLDVWNP